MASGRPTPYTSGFFLKTLLPSSLTIILFVVSIFAVIIPALEKNFLEAKRQMIRELTNSASSLVEEFYQEFKTGRITEDQAKAKAISRVRGLRYGAEKKDYFWISDMEPRMIMHPYRTELDGTDLSDYKDVNGKRLFVEFVKSVKQSGNGYVEYMWQWKNNPSLSCYRT